MGGHKKKEGGKEKKCIEERQERKGKFGQKEIKS